MNKIPKNAIYWKIYTRINGQMYLEYSWKINQVLWSRVGSNRGEHLEAWEIGQLLGGN